MTVRVRGKIEKKISLNLYFVLLYWIQRRNLNLVFRKHILVIIITSNTFMWDFVILVIYLDVYNVNTHIL